MGRLDSKTCFQFSRSCFILIEGIIDVESASLFSFSFSFSFLFFLFFFYLGFGFFRTLTVMEGTKVGRQPGAEYMAREGE